jgi:competence protein ComEC
VAFAFVTRFEPSVLRATAMAAVAAAAAWRGRPGSALHHLAIAVTGLVLVDPLLVHALGFQLSVGACTAIVVLARPMAAAIPGPRLLAEPLAVTVAAQLGVAPILVQSFGGVPVVAVPANLAAGPAVAPLTIVGLASSLVLGAAGPTIPAGWVATAQLPTRLLADWLLLVAQVSAHAGLGMFDGTALAIGAGAGAAVAVAGRGIRRSRARR